MTSCEGCGASIDANDNECPYCGYSVKKRVDIRQASRTHDSARERVDIRKDGRTYGVDRDADGSASVRFGDGQSGRRLSSGKGSVSSQYRHGAGSSGNISGKLVAKLDRLNHQIEKGPDLSRQQGSKDMGVALIEYFSTMGDLLSLYQDAVSRESHLDTNDRDRLSANEEKIRPKLRGIVTFCDKVKSETRKKMGLSGGDIRKIKKTAIKTLKMTEYRMCSRCGAMSKPRSRRCRKCKASL